MTDLSPELATKVEQLSTLLRGIAQDYSPAVFANSLGAEDMLLHDLIARLGLAIEVFSLDTGRLPAPTYELLAQARQRYPQAPIKVYFPKAESVEGYVAQNGINAFYDSVELRKECCRIRKMEPLARAFTGKKAWITGLRRQQSTTRSDMPLQEYDAANGLEKFNPLLEWSEAEVWQYIKALDVPYNALHDQHYPSIGCAPCTRAIAMGEDIRAGRWWWENPENKECGLHAKISILPVRS